jgi:hypothetical protein
MGSTIATDTPSALWPSLPLGSILFHDSSISEHLRAEVEFNIRVKFVVGLTKQLRSSVRAKGAYF